MRRNRDRDSKERNIRSPKEMEARGSVTIKKGDIYYADLMPVIGSEQGGIRPVLIIQNDVGNYYSPTVIVAAITSRPNKHSIPTHIRVGQAVRGLRRRFCHFIGAGTYRLTGYD